MWCIRSVMCIWMKKFMRMRRHGCRRDGWIRVMMRRIRLLCLGGARRLDMLGGVEVCFVFSFGIVHDMVDFVIVQEKIPVWAHAWRKLSWSWSYQCLCLALIWVLLIRKGMDEGKWHCHSRIGMIFCCVDRKRSFGWDLKGGRGYNCDVMCGGDMDYLFLTYLFWWNILAPSLSWLF